MNNMYGNPAVECDGAQLRALCRQLATVVTVSGEIDEANVECIGDYAKRFVLMEKPFVLDLSGVSSFSTECISLLYRLDEDCDHAGVEWLIIASAPVLRTLKLFGERETFPTAVSVPEALHHFADSMGERRRLLPLLTKTA